MKLEFILTDFYIKFLEMSIESYFNWLQIYAKKAYDSTARMSRLTSQVINHFILV